MFHSGTHLSEEKREPRRVEVVDSILALGPKESDLVMEGRSVDTGVVPRDVVEGVRYDGLSLGEGRDNGGEGGGGRELEGGVRRDGGGVEERSVDSRQMFEG